ncbi:hypothetical protein MTR67_045682 [Solanum verrucosum]|uniref:Uncharacterized protein n=1 Tax=Solanum verrucosum TaxID=315347 RepID=A0AAF0UTH5_SOLVR|nr:hypothetical protein MTR67_045682 [Solanum verrucosum]
MGMGHMLRATIIHVEIVRASCKGEWLADVVKKGDLKAQAVKAAKAVKSGSTFKKTSKKI